jgi:hypothetical protein
MLVLLAVPVIVVTAVVHRLVQTTAPSNVLIAHIRRARPHWRAGVGLVILALACLVAVHILTAAMAAGAPAWLNLPILILAWDAIRFMLLGVSTIVRTDLRSVLPVRRAV